MKNLDFEIPISSNPTLLIPKSKLVAVDGIIWNGSMME
jgi:hypothetical protein